MMILMTVKKSLWTVLVCAGFVNAFELKVDGQKPVPSSKAHCLVFEDRFNRLDTKKWQHEITMSGGGNWEFQWYTNNRSNSYTEDGILYLKPTLTSELLGDAAVMSGGTLNLWSGEPAMSCTDNSNFGCVRTSGAASGGNYLNPIQSAKLKTIDSIAIQYGKVEVRARLPVGDWLWPAIWMMPKHAAYGGWPASGEIDIMESRGNMVYPYGNASVVTSTLHWGTHYDNDRYNLTEAGVMLDDGTTFADDFHIYGLEWTEEGLRTYVDDKTILLVDFDQPFYRRGQFPSWVKNPWSSGDVGAPFDQEFYLIINLAVGGTNGYWPDAPGKPWGNHDPHAVNSFWDRRDEWLPTWGDSNKNAFAIDWVKIWSADKNC